jgi:hypothetical protein
MKVCLPIFLIYRIWSIPQQLNQENQCRWLIFFYLQGSFRKLCISTDVTWGKIITKGKRKRDNIKKERGEEKRECEVKG